ncbi:unnamed protein product [Danaus chrysippus]|uniref:(African queen) hypothetical protein n=1 Tax=Danaus chrysippus TaxID=151541 RepID=A0A8J2QIU9_9NEOP|nr:unnamed protein product [Danaus chrysippus]
MIRNIALILAAVVASHLCLASPVPEPDPFFSKPHRTHIKIHVPYEVRSYHHHHVEKVPVIHEVPILKEVPVPYEVPVVKHVPIINTVPVPIVKTVAIEKPVFLPYKEHYGYH